MNNSTQSIQENIDNTVSKHGKKISYNIYYQNIFKYYY